VELLEIEPEQEEIKERALQLADCCLRPMIEALPAIYRDALIMTDLEGLSQKALAEKLGISISGAKSRVQRAREKLKEEILNCCQYEFDKYGNIISCCNNKIEKTGNCC
jgi:RNA polymerase sigma-70 factor, ECF subfamily